MSDLMREVDVDVVLQDGEQAVLDTAGVSIQEIIDWCAENGAMPFETAVSGMAARKAYLASHVAE